MADPLASTGAGSMTQRWQLQAGAALPQPGDRRRRHLLVLAGLLLALVSIAAIWFLLMRPPPAPPFLLTIDLGEHNARQYPVLAFARQDGTLLERHFPDKKQAQTKTRELLLSELNALASRTEPLVVLITALALVRDENVLLVPGDADPDDDATLLDVRQVIEAIGRCPAAHKLLILDIAQPIADPRLGVLSDRVAQTLEEMLQVEPPSFHVLCSASASEVSLRSEVLHSSVLAHYLDRGLQGAADTDNELRITVTELAAFVRSRVDRWAQLNRGLHQRPKLFGVADNFVLIGLGKSRPAPVEPPTLAAYPAALQEGWTKRDQWRDQGAIHRAPRLLMKLEAHLLRQEALWHGGIVVSEDWDAFGREVARLDRELAVAAISQPMPLRSVAVAQGAAKDNPVLIEAVQSAFVAARDGAAKKDGRAALIASLVKTLQEPKDVSAAQQAGAILAALDRVAELRPEQLQLAQDVLAVLQVRPRYGELVCLRRLSEFAERVQARDPDSWPAAKAHALLQAVWRRERLLAALSREPGLLAWVAPAIVQADGQRQHGETLLLWERPSRWTEAFTALHTARELYQQAGEMLEAAVQARAALERALADLPAYRTLVCDWPEFQVHAEATWRDAAREALQLQSKFAEREPTTTSVRALDTQRRGLERYLDGLDRMLAQYRSASLKGENGIAVSQAHSLLQGPLLRAPERQAMLAGQRALAAKLQAQTDDLDQQEGTPARTNGPPIASSADTERGIARLRLSLALLRLGGIPGDGLTEDVTGRLKPRAWTRLESGVQTLWSRALVERWQTTTAPAAADTLDRLVPPWELDRRAPEMRSPTRRLQQDQRAAFLRWLAERYDADAQAITASGRDALAAAFCRDAARELRLASQDGSP